MTLEIFLPSEADTLKLGEQCGALALALPKKQLVIGLVGELGAGKTTFARGLANSLEIEESVCSPTFTMLNEYNSGLLPLYHFDLYRLSEGAQLVMQEVSYEIAELLFGPGVFVVEWVDLCGSLIADVEDLRFQFRYLQNGGRQVTIFEKRTRGLLQQIRDRMTTFD